MSNNPAAYDSSKPAAMAIPKEGYFTRVEGRYGPVYPRTPACYGFSILAKVKAGREPVFYDYARRIESTVAQSPDCLAVLKLHYLRWVMFPIKGETYFMYQGIFDTDFDKYTEDAISLFTATGISTVFENLDDIQAQLTSIYRREAIPIDVTGRKSAAWGQPWMTRYLSWKRAAKRRPI